MSGKPICKIGDVFARLRIVERVGSDPSRAARWRCLCICGGETVTTSHDLRSGHTSSCGCFGKEARKEAATTHGLSKTPTYHCWQAMKTRCYSASHISYPNYGGRGIIVCDRWKDSFEAFLEDMGEKPAGLTIERINNDGNYEPENCTWVTKAVNNQTKRPKRRVTLTREQGEFIFKMRQEGMRICDIHQEYFPNVHYQTIRDAAAGRTWK